MKTLEVDSVVLSFKGREILSDVYLKCETGDIVGIIGRNGTGKSCLLKILFGSLRAENQSVRINEKYVTECFSIPGAIKYLPQQGLLMDHLCFNDYVKIFQLESYLDELMKVNELLINRSTPICKLSGGIGKLIEIFALLYADTDFLLLDEPFSYLSPVMVEIIIPHIKKQALKKGIIITDHQYETVLSVTTRKYLLANRTLREIHYQKDLVKYGYVNLDEHK